MHTLVDLLNHGLLPFTGREKEVSRIIEFWRGGLDAPGLQMTLLIGEAGMGKSRLLEEVTSQIVRIGGGVVHTKLYPESATSVAPLIARALWQYSASHPQLKIEPEENLSSVIASLRRLARLRHILLVFEDIHLLNGPGIGSFASVLEALADEQVSVLCLSRPADLPVKGVLERHLVEEIELPRLSEEDVASLWSDLFAVAPDPDLVRTIVKVTSGNPLAVRSALRVALKSGAITSDPLQEGWRLAIPIKGLEESLVRNVELLSEGMVSHLGESERSAAEQIASLGEVVARESALAMVNGDASILGLLAFKGILLERGAVMPALPGDTSKGPLLAFTHTLLHRRLASGGTKDVGRLLSLLASNAPLYSIVPFQIVLDEPVPPMVPPDVIQRLTSRASLICSALNGTHDWGLGLTVREATARIVEANIDVFTVEDACELRAELLNVHLQLLFRGDYKEEYARLVDELLELTSHNNSPKLLELRLMSMVHLLRLRRREDYSRCLEVWEIVEELIEAHPFLRNSYEYIFFLIETVTSARTTADVATMRRVEERFEGLLASGEVGDDVKERGRRTLYPYLLDLIETREEAARKMAILEELMSRWGDIRLLSMKALILHTIGDIDQAEAIIATELIPRFRASGMHYNLHQSEIILLQISSSRGLPLSEVEREAQRIAREVPEGMRLLIRQTIGIHLCYEGFLRGDPAWSIRIYDQFIGPDQSIAPGLRFVIALAKGRRDDALAIELPDEPRFTVAQSILRSNVSADATSIISAAAGLFALPILTTVDVVGFMTTLRLIEEMALEKGKKNIADALAEEIHSAITGVLEWFDEHRLVAYLAVMLERTGSYLTRSEQSRWKIAGASLRRHAEEKEREGRASDGAMRLRMLGTITAEWSSSDTDPENVARAPVSPRGIRLRTLLGLMVADRMLERPLQQREFCRLSAIDIPEFEDARKTMNLTVHRLRESLGHEIILTDRDTPRLNPDIVRVDLLEADERLSEAFHAVRDGSYPRAHLALLETLEIVGNSVPFPSLYDDFFEAAREDFETRLRSTVMKVAQGLVREGDAASAEAILRRAFDAMPGDEELGSLLGEVLVQLDKRIEAQRVRLQTIS